jgi:hypothetical protein
MAILSTPVEKAEKRLTNIRADIESARARLGTGLDFEAAFALREEIALLERKEAAAVEALCTAKAMEAKAAAEAERAKELAEVEAYRREAKREVPALFTKYAKHAEGAAAALSEIDAHVSKVGRINALARKHGVAGVTDGEQLFRGTPTRFIPAQYEERDVVRAANGRHVHEFWDVHGVFHSHHGPCTGQRERVEIRGQTVEPGGIPGGRIAPDVRHVNLKGDKIWPVRR